MTTPHGAMGRGFPWLPVIFAVVIVAGFGIWALTWILSPAVNGIDSISQRNQVNHLHRQQAVQNAQNQLTYGSIGYQDAQIADMHQNLTNITGPAGLALTRAGLAKGDPEQQTLQASEDDQVNSFCAEGVKVAPSNPQFTDGSPSLKQLYDANCSAGTAVANPPLAQNPVPHGGI